MKSRLTRMTGVAAAALLATTMAAAAQSQTDSRGNAMGSQNVGNGAPHTGTMAPGTTTGMGGKRMNGANDPAPSANQGMGTRGGSNSTGAPSGSVGR
ncbi:hypothetical protein BJ123_108129 [Rhodopseudomonas thermotolerans]|jgi:hypothetical protein|uniref:Pentapeptide MXKDX repeat protein n=2 Tax=Rhodopseudomonas TaxID=1073 RepID=A0A336JM44_9BRAD|nr:MULTISPECIES: hypothetical protein [Rhodopseudomonas]RED36195.1 hypothetical protein BJ125_108129 [Rhodopseudomonas pentothenatexigens]REG03567.1 hypothetical protein BJ123_108129 [Rhodopseudomonas thermotolerans]SSW90755.1 hypothetical protein SAMN05892882_108129 [Rhodopseudomonas pentothenatexigens]